MNKLLLLSGNDIPFAKGRLTIHPPKLKEIAFIGEDAFYLGSNFLCFSKDNLREQDKINLGNKSNFDVLMSMINNKTDTIVKSNQMFIDLLLSLLFPGYQLVKMPNMLLFNKETENEKEQGMINNDNYEQFKKIIRQMFCLDIGEKSGYNPANKVAQRLAKKFQDRRRKLSKKTEAGEKKQISILSKYVSILVLGNRHTYEQLMQYTVYQLFDEFKRFEKKLSYDSWFSAKLAGAEGLDDVDSWLSDQEDKPVTAKSNSRRIEY